MKKLLMSLVVITLLFAAGCSNTLGEAPDNSRSALGTEEPNEWGIFLSVENVTPTSLTLTCTRNGGNPTEQLLTGSSYAIQRLVGGEWHTVPTLFNQNPVWTLEAYDFANDGSNITWDLNWEFLYGELWPGIYRVRKSFRVYLGMGAFTNVSYYAEFTIVD